jgi:WD40 repeat protein
MKLTYTSLVSAAIASLALLACQSGPSAENRDPRESAHENRRDDRPSTQRAQRIRGHSDVVMSIDLSDDGGLLVSGGLDGMVKLWDVDSAEPVWEFEHGCQTQAGEKKLRSVTLSPEAERIAVACQRQIRVFDVLQQRELRRFEVIDQDALAPRYAVEFGPDGDRIAAVGWETGAEGVRLWSIESGTLDAEFTGYGPVAFSPDGQLIAVNLAKPDEEKTERERKTIALNQTIGLKQQYRVGIYDIASEHLLRSMQGEERADDALAFAPDGKFLAGTNGGSVTIWEVSTGKQRQSAKVVLEGSRAWASAPHVLALGFAGDGKRVAVASYSGSHATVALDTGDASSVVQRRLEWGGGDDVRGPIDYPNLFYFREQMLDLDRGGRRLASAPGGATIIVWDIASGEKHVLK